MIKLDTLLPIELYAKNKNLTNKDVIGLGIMGKLDIFYAFDGDSLVIYEPISDLYKAHDTKGNIIADEGCIEIDYFPQDLLPITKEPLSLLYTYNQTELINLVRGNTPDGFIFNQMLDGENRVVDTSKVFIDPDSLRQKPSIPIAQGIEEFTVRPTKTSLKVIGLLMTHLAKSPKYASGASPNKSQIKELLLDLAEEFDVNSYGLAKVDERLLSDALKHIESQKN